MCYARDGEHASPAFLQAEAYSYESDFVQFKHHSLWEAFWN